MLLDHQPVPIDVFKGLYGIDSYDDSVPPNYFVDELNTITYGSELKTRDGFDLAHTTGAVLRFEVYRRQGEAARVLVLVGNSIIDLTTAVTILTVVGMTDFTINYANNRAYISPHTGTAGVSGSFVYVYNGAGVARKAAGLAPVGGFTVAASASAGVVESGTHIFAWVFITDSGFVTHPSGAETLLVDGTKAVSFTNIPLGPAGTAARRLIASRAIQNYNGNEEGYEMFFVPGALINDNATTTLSDVDFFDADLQLSADYTYDQLTEIPAVVFIRTYGSRMAYGGPDSDRNLVYYSKPGEPESIHSSAGFVSYDPFETEGVKDGTEFRDNFYVTKRTKTYTVRDNSFEPSTWKPVTLDSAIGADINGIAKFLDSTGSRVEFFVVNSPSGIYKFTGVYEEIPISRNIKARVWDRINKTYLNKSQIIFDQERLLLYVLLTLDGAVAPNYILVGNYEEGFTFQTIKWHLWSFVGFSPNCIAVDRDSNRKTVLKIGSLSGNIYEQEEGLKQDAGAAINQFVKFGLVGDGVNIMHFGGVQFRIIGSGTLGIELFGQDDVDYQELADLTLAATPGREYFRPAFLSTERASLKIGMNAVNAYFKLRKIAIYANTFVATRPNV